MTWNLLRAPGGLAWVALAWVGTPLRADEEAGTGEED